MPQRDTKAYPSSEIFQRIVMSVLFFSLGGLIASQIYPDRNADLKPVQSWISICIVLGFGFIALLMALPKKAGRKFFGFIRFDCRRWVFENLITPTSLAAITGIGAIYLTIFECFGSDWTVFIAYPVAHKWIKVILCVLVGLWSFGIYWREKWSEGSIIQTEHLLNEVFTMVSHIVDGKIQRVARLLKIAPVSRTRRELDDFSKQQFQSIFSESATFLQKAFDIHPDHIDITILEKKDNLPWAFYASHQLAWEHGPIDELFLTSSCARKALESGEQIFHPSKLFAEEDGEYTRGKRDHQKKGDGSIFCEAVKIARHSGNPFTYIISVVTYGDHRFCNANDVVNENQTKVILSDITRRIKLEIHAHLLSLR